MIAALADHLWQSTLLAGAAAGLTLALRRQGARVRYAVLLAAAVKFLVPFAALAMAVHWAARALHAPSAPIDVGLLRRAAEPATAFVTAPKPDTARNAVDLDTILAAVWLAGTVTVVAFRARQWLRLQRTIRAAAPMTLPAPAPVLAAGQHEGPAVAGLLRPVLLLPSGLSAQLSTAEFEGVIAHELQHLKRRDNLTVLAPMAAQALFWFHPVVWWLHARLLAEREQACDEAVLRAGADPQTYAAGLLKVCRFYLAPQAPAAAAARDDLKARVQRIMQGDAPTGLQARHRLLLASAAVTALALPVLAGLAGPPPVSVLPAPARAIAAAVQPPARALAPPAPVRALVRPDAPAPLVKIALVSAPAAMKAPLDVTARPAPLLQLARAPSLPQVQLIQAESEVPPPAALPRADRPSAPILGNGAASVMKTGDWSGSLSVRAAYACPATDVRRAIDRLQGLSVSTAFDGAVRRFVADAVGGWPDPASLTPAFNRTVQRNLPMVQPALSRFGRPAPAGLLGEDANARDLYLVPAKDGGSYALVLVDDAGRIVSALFCSA